MLLRVRVQPGAARPGVAGVQGDELKLRVAAAAVEGRPNRAGLLGVPRPSVVLVGGASSRSKRFLVRGATAEAARARLSAHLERGRRLP